MFEIAGDDDRYLAAVKGESIARQGHLASYTQHILLQHIGRPAVDVLHIDRTADHLRRHNPKPLLGRSQQLQPALCALDILNSKETWVEPHLDRPYFLWLMSDMASALEAALVWKGARKGEAV